jgi:RimJ/RimL family protein N-acetyltransferase
MSFPRPDWARVSASEAEAIRAALRAARGIDRLGGRREVLAERHIPALYELVRDPAVSDPIYIIAKPVTPASVAVWAAEMIAAQGRGEGLTLMNFDVEGALIGFTEALVWPDFAAGEIGGALRADHQGRGEGPTGFVAIVDWLFDEIGVRRIALTAATDNLRSQKMIDRAGFVRRGEIDSLRPDGSIRRSVYWELEREVWRQVKSGEL